LGISAVLFNSAEVLFRSDWRDIALSLARKEATKTLNDIEAHNRCNYGFCHGSAGRAHIFNRFYQATQEDLFLDAAIRWLDYTLSLRRPDSGIGGFLLDEPADGGPKPATGLLTGAAGLGLVLLASVSEITPEWDRVFLVSV
jgi:lantibiotic modifying enzyme